MQSHRDRDAETAREYLGRLKERAEENLKNRAADIAAGKPGETELASWESNGFDCRHMPNDEQGIIRISAGGNNGEPLEFKYCAIRGSVGDCIALLEEAIVALKDAP